MIPLIRSLKELMEMTNPRNTLTLENENHYSRNSKEEDDEIRKRYIKSENKKNLGLPELPNVKMQKWVKSKKAVSKFFDELDYNNQIQSSYDLTLLERQGNQNEYDVA